MSKSTKKNLNQWLSWLESLHPTEIDLGLVRIKQVAIRLLPTLFETEKKQSLPFTLITVGGTNGKGSTIAFIQSIVQSSGYKTGVYTSPHLVHYNERIQVDSQFISDDELCDVFEKIETVRGNISLTYFEYGTLAAIYYFYIKQCDVVILEVGLGGRLDAVNILDADCSILTTVDLDHQQWLGDDIESIAHEKAGIYRKNQVAVYGDTNTPDSVIKYTEHLGLELLQYGKDYCYQKNKHGWSIKSLSSKADIQIEGLSFPQLAGDIQLKNACNAIVAISHLKQLPLLSQDSINQGIKQAFICGRYQYLAKNPDVIIDVAHNPQSALMLNEFLSANNFQGQTHAIFSILKDKDITAVIQHLADIFDSWHIVPLDTPRACQPEELKNILLRHTKDTPVTCYNDFSDAYKALTEQINSRNIGDLKQSENCLKSRIIVFGSFYIVAQALEYFYES